MLPQSQALESTSADNLGVRTKRDVDNRRSIGRKTGVQHGRGETPVDLTNQQKRYSPSSGQYELGEDRGLNEKLAASTTAPTATAPRVFVLDRHGYPLMPCHPARARKLLKSGRARVHRLAPFVIRLVDRTVAESTVDGVEVGIDPGSKFTGISVFRTSPKGRVGLVSIEIQHRGDYIHKKMQQRASYRRGRRSRNLRYRAPRFLNRHPAKCQACGKNAKHGKRYCGPCLCERNFVDNGYRQRRLSPSLRHRLDTTMSMVIRLQRWAPITAIHYELVRFDTQKMENPDISGVEYRHGTLAGYEVREYLLEKWERKCAYCGTSGVPLNIDHIQPRSLGGSNRVSNLTLACVPCNQSKGSSDLKTWLAFRFNPLKAMTIAKRVLAQAKAPLKDAAVVNSTRWALYWALRSTKLPVFTGSGGRTKWNRKRFSLPKTHTLDALCVGQVNGVISYLSQVIVAKARGRGTYARTVPDSFGFPRLYLPRVKTIHGFQTGDLVCAKVPTGTKAGVYVGRVVVRSCGSFDISTASGKIQKISYRYCTILQRADGWEWTRKLEECMNTV
jgi:5-methylcytosine-specific restriction endonuclease McrA